MKRRVFIKLAAAGTVSADGLPWDGRAAAGKDSATDLQSKGLESQLAAGFAAPPRSAQPRVYWDWLNGFVSETQIAKDLEEMRRMGIAGALIFDVAPGVTGDQSILGPKPEGGVPISPVGVPIGAVFMSDEWRSLFRHAVREAARLDLEIGLMLGSGWNCGGPWISPRHGSRRLVWSELTARGPGAFAGVLPAPAPQVKARHVPLQPETVSDIAVLAIRADEGAAAFSRSGASGAIRDWGLKAGYEEIEGTTPDLLGWPEEDGAGGGAVPVSDVIDLTALLGDGGTLRWEVPAGEWLILRLAHAYGGRPRQQYTPGAGGIMLDHLSAEAMDIHFRATAEKLISDVGDLAGNTLKFLECDSCDIGTVNWTPDFASEFSRRRGYEMRPYLPALMGRLVESREVTERFLHDFRQTIGDCIADNHYGRFRELCRGHGLELRSESGGPPPVPIDALKCLGRNDVPMAEFWAMEQTMFVRGAASAAHTGGRRLAAAEALTTWGHWTDGPMELKSFADRAFCEGINLLYIHGFSSSPPEAGLPGYVYFAGTHVNPNITWWEQARPFMDYLARCQFMLQRGLAVADVCCYYGDQVPNFIPPDRRYMYELCPSLGEDYACDFADIETLLTRFEVREGCLVLADGMRYRLLVFPDAIAEGFPCRGRFIQPELLRKLIYLVSAGATVVWPRPSMAPGLRGYPDCDSEIRALAGKLWGPADGRTVLEHRVGEGRVVWGKTPRQVLLEQGIPPDFECRPAARLPHERLAYIHRRDGDADIYFISNRDTQKEVSASCLFRVCGKIPELWHPDTGEIRGQTVYDEVDGRTAIPLRLPPAGSVFVVFRSPSDRNRVVRTAKNGKTFFPASADLPAESSGLEVISAAPGRVEAAVSAPGAYELRDASGRIFRACVDEIPGPLLLRGPWKLRFLRGPGAPEEIALDVLISWTEHGDPRVRYFSGTASYHADFTLPRQWFRKDTRIRLSLGTVKNLAGIGLNGKDCGLLWRPPFASDVTAAARPGRNRLEVRVTNLWPNRLIGDAFLQEDERHTRTNIAAFTRLSPLLESGLLGPVEFRPVRIVTMRPVAGYPGRI